VDPHNQPYHLEKILFATRWTLYFSMSPSTHNLILKNHLNLIVLHPFGKCAILQVLLFSMEENFDLIASFQNFASKPNNVSVIVK
jgi:hypothetical protein